MCNYIGITIGPIFDTIMDASSPAALWFASSLFSDMSRRVCVEIKNTFSDAEIYSPYFADDIKMDDGVGKFHDRIIFSTEQYDRKKLQECIRKVKRETANCFSEALINADTKEFFEQYIQMPFVKLEEDEIEEKNSVLALSPYLDALELMRSFPADSSNNVIRKLFCGEETGGNVYIKQSPLFQGIEENSNQLKKDQNGLWTVEDIASDHGKIEEVLKRKDYYAVVQADGDNMGKFLAGLDHTAVTEFSKACLDYDKKVCEKVGNFGGMTIYAGGDDLLFLAPVVNRKGKNIFELCVKIGELFREQLESVDVLKNNSNIPTVSFGIALQYKNFPLYEAFARGRELLSLAKSTSQKDNMAIELLKHSGKSMKVIVPNKEYPVLEEVLPFEKEDEKTVHSVIYTLQKFQKLIFVLDSKLREKKINEDLYESAFMNLFDHMEQANLEKYLRKICHIYLKYFAAGNTKICVPKELEERLDKAVSGGKEERNQDVSLLKVYLQLLLIKKFFVERQGEEH